MCVFGIGERDDGKWGKVMREMGWPKLIIRVPKVDRWAIGYFI